MSQRPSPALELKDVRCTWFQPGAMSDETIEGVTLSLEQGEWCAIVGDNGLGKSTLLHGIAGSCPIVSGTIKVHGHVLRPRDLAQRFDLGAYFVPQEPKCPGRWTFRDILAMSSNARSGLVPGRVIDALRKALSAEGILDPNEQRHFTPREARILLGILANPSVLLLDEIGGQFGYAFRNGPGPNGRRDMYTFIKKNIPNSAVMFVEHDQAIAKEYSNKILHMYMSDDKNLYRFRTLTQQEFTADVQVQMFTTGNGGELHPLLDLERGVADNLTLARRAARGSHAPRIRRILENAAAAWPFIRSNKTTDQLSGGQKIILHCLMEFAWRGVADLAHDRMKHVFPRNVELLKYLFRHDQSSTNG